MVCISASKLYIIIQTHKKLQTFLENSGQTMCSNIHVMRFSKTSNVNSFSNFSLPALPMLLRRTKHHLGGGMCRIKSIFDFTFTVKL